VYGADLQDGLVLCWAVLRAPAGKLLAPMLPVLVPMLRSEKARDTTDGQAAQSSCRVAGPIPSPDRC
jgi:hypothetical protein